jgi:hypothetical protein
MDDDGVQVVTKGVKSNLIAEVKAQQGALLAETDWAVIRNADTGDAIPANIATYRAAIRSKATEMETAIADAADTDAVAALFVSVRRWMTTARRPSLASCTTGLSFQNDKEIFLSLGFCFSNLSSLC